MSAVQIPAEMVRPVEKRSMGTAVRAWQGMEGRIVPSRSMSAAAIHVYIPESAWIYWMNLCVFVLEDGEVPDASLR